ncbi:hypothetical protein Ancab_010381 [Ancistrocladus abbreviatus]
MCVFDGVAPLFNQVDRQRCPSSIGVGLNLQSLCHGSIATAGQPEYDEEDNQVVAKKRQEASPEESDQAAIGPSTTKAKVEAKLYESPKVHYICFKKSQGTTIRHWSYFEGYSCYEQEALKRRLTARIDCAKFLQDTAKQMAKEVHNSCGGEIKKAAEDLDNILNKVRTGSSVF